MISPARTRSTLKIHSHSRPAKPKLGHSILITAFLLLCAFLLIRQLLVAKLRRSAF